jgi:hypothetical protein
LFRTRHSRASDEYRYDRYSAAKCGCQLDPHKVARIIKPPLSRIILRVQPVRPNNSQQHAAARHALIDRFPEILPRFDARYIHEYSVLAEVLGEFVEKTAGFSLRVVPSIVHKERAQG